MKKVYKIFQIVDNNQDFNRYGPLQTHSLREPFWAYVGYVTEEEAFDHLTSYCEEFTNYTILPIYQAE